VKWIAFGPATRQAQAANQETISPGEPQFILIPPQPNTDTDPSVTVLERDRMKKEMLINVLQPEECRIAIVEDGGLEGLYVERLSTSIAKKARATSRPPVSASGTANVSASRVAVAVAMIAVARPPRSP
jgi:hypothetical protein